MTDLDAGLEVTEAKAQRDYYRDRLLVAELRLGDVTQQRDELLQRVAVTSDQLGEALEGLEFWRTRAEYAEHHLERRSVTERRHELIGKVPERRREASWGGNFYERRRP